MDKFLITGCSGFVAEHFLEYLLQNVANSLVMGIARRDNFSFAMDNFQYIKADMLGREKLKFVLADFKPNYIVHLAASSSVGQSWLEPVETFQNNTNIFLNLVETIRELNLSCRVLSVGSSEVYKADSLIPIKEIDALAPKNPYGVARLAQEMISKLYVESYGLDIVMTRSFNHTGPRQSDRFVVPSFIKQMLQIAKNPANNVMNVGNIEVERDFLDVRDVVEAYCMLLMHGKKGEIYNVCSSHGRKLKDVISEASKILNIDVVTKIDPSRLRPNEIMSIVGDNSKIYNDLSWKPKYTFTQTIKDMISYYF